MVTSVSNPKIKNVIKCIKQSKERKRQGVFIVEGVRMFSEIPTDLHVESFATEEFYNRHEELFKDIQFEIVSDNVMNAISLTKTPQGVVSLVKRLDYSLEEVCRGGDNTDNEVPLIIALENIQDPGNLGTILRTAEGAGVDGIIMSGDTVDIYNPKVVRSTMGSIFRVPFCYVENLTETVKSLSDKGYESYGAHLQGVSFYDFDYTKPTIFCMGNEGNGLTDELSKETHHKILIPMKGQVESLNVATATTVLVYEAMRQRNANI